MTVQSNIPAINAHRNLNLNNSALSKSLEKLSSGYKINRAGDDAAGLAISEKMRSQIRGLEMAEQNTENAISLIQTAEGGLNETHAILQRMRELAVQSNNGTYTDDDRAQITTEYNALMDEIDRISLSTHYNGINLLDGTIGAGPATEDSYATIFGNGIINGGGLSFVAFAADAYGINLTHGQRYDISFVCSFTAGQQTCGMLLNGQTFMMEQHPIIPGGYYLPAYDELGLDQSIVFSLGWTREEVDVNGKIIYPTTPFDTALYTNETFVLAFDFIWDEQNGVLVDANADAGGTINLWFSPNLTISNSSNPLSFQIGANGSADQRVGLYVNNMSTANLGGAGMVLAQTRVDTIANANAALATLDASINMVSSQRAELGALQNRLEHTLNSLGVSIENLTAAESTIRDTDMAKQMMQFTQQSVLVQAAQAMLAQANTLPQGILGLLN